MQLNKENHADIIEDFVIIEIIKLHSTLWYIKKLVIPIQVVHDYHIQDC